MEYKRLGTVDLKSNVGSRVYVSFMLRDLSIRLQKDKVTKFATFNMVDKDTVVEARVFGIDDAAIENLAEGKVYDAAIDVKAYDKSPSGYSCIVYNMDFSQIPAEYFADWADGLDESRKIIEDAIGECYDTIYGKVTYHIIVNNWDKISKWSAAARHHHTQLGGLLTHTAEVVQICDVLSDVFTEKYGDNIINRPLLLCSAILHDVGKTTEYDVDTLSGKTEMSKHSVLATHIMDDLTLVDKAASELGFGNRYITDENGNILDEKRADILADETEALELLKHCLAAHHGKLEWGSPIKASVPEAEILFFADEISAIMYKYNREMKKLEPGSFVSLWESGSTKNIYRDTSKVDESDTEE